MMAKRVAEELESFDAATPRFLAVMVHREPRHHADVRIDRVADGHAFSRKMR